MITDRSTKDQVGPGAPDSGGTGGGEANTSSNSGAGAQLALPKSGVNLPFRSVVAGTNINIVQNALTLEISAADQGGEANTSSNSGTGAQLALPKSGVNLPFRSVVAGTNISIVENALTLEISAADQGGEANTSSNAGAGAQLALPKSGLNLPFRTLVEGDNVSLTQNAETIVVSAANPGEVNTSSNSGAGAQLALPKSGLNLPFRTLVQGDRITIIQNAETIEIIADDQGGEANTSSNSGAGAQLALPKSGVNLPFRSVVAGDNVTITQNANDIVIAAPSAGGISIGGIESFSTGSMDTGRNSSNVVWAVHVLALYSITIDRLHMMITSVGTDNWWMGMYNGALDLIGETAQLSTPATTGFDSHPTLAPIPIIGGQDYWFAFRGDFGSTNWGAQNCYSDFDLARQIYYTTPGLPARLDHTGVTTADRAFWIAGSKQ